MKVRNCLKQASTPSLRLQKQQLAWRPQTRYYEELVAELERREAA